ncbi:TPA: type VI secretion system baseplate subunit TssE [Escherichia coli]
MKWKSFRDYGLPDLSLIHQGMAAGIHGLMRQIEETLLRYEPRLSQIQVELLPQPRPGHLNYLIHAQLPDTGWIRFDGVFSPEGRIVLRHLKQQERAY